MSGRRELRARVLAEAKRLFDDMLGKEQYPLILNAHTVIGETLTMPASQVAIVLRSLHREGKIGLLNGQGIACSIGPDQASMGSVNQFVTHDPRRVRGAKLAIKPGQLSVATHEENSEEEYDIQKILEALDLLQGEVTDLTRRNAALTGKLSTANNKLGKAKRETGEAKKRKETAEGEARRLRSELATLRTEAAKVPELLEQLAALQGEDTVDQELASKIDRLTSG